MRKTVDGSTLKRADDGSGWEFDYKQHRLEFLQTTAPGYRRAWDARITPLHELHRTVGRIRKPTLDGAVKSAKAFVEEARHEA